MNSTDFQRFLGWEATTHDTIDFKKVYVDVAGDLVAGLLLSQIVYWHLPSRQGDTKLRVAKDGEWWIVKGREDWWEEVRITPKRFDRACAILIKRGIIVKTYGRFDGLRKMHIRIVGDIFLSLWEQALDDISHAVPERGTASYPKGEDRSSRKGKTELPERVRPLTESTTETTTESTIAPTAQTPTALSEKRSKDQDRREEQRTSKMTTRNGKRPIAELHGAERVYGSTTLRIYPTLSDHIPEIEVAEIWLEPEDTQLTCPHCDHVQAWPQSEGMRRRALALICQVGEGAAMDGCGTYFIVHAYKKSGARFTYQVAVPKPLWVVVLHAIKWHTTEDEARLFLSNWDEDCKFLLEKFKWATAPETGMVRIWRRDEVVIQRVNAAYATGMKKRTARQAERDRPAEPTEVLVDPETGQTYVEEGRY